MKYELISEDLKDLMREKSETCISLIIPQHATRAHKKEDETVISHAIAKLNTLLKGKHDGAIVNQLTDKLSDFRDRLSERNGMKGIGVFMSEHLFKLIEFPFDVTEKIQVDNSFEIRDVLYHEIQMKEYLLLLLTKDEYRLFKGKGNHLIEIKDTNFPIHFNEYEYNIPIEDEQPENISKTVKSTVKTENHKEFYNILNSKLKDYFEGPIPLYVAGVTSELADFENGTELASKIKGRIEGSYQGYNFEELQGKVWEAVKSNQESEEKELLRSLTESRGKALLASGIEHVWRDAKAGKGNVLIVERDLMQPGFTGGDELYLWTKPPVGEHRIVSDAVDDIIEMVLEKGGEVKMVENGLLEEFKGIALINRY